MNLQQLRYVVEVARTGSITQAARNLYMGQPNLSKSIKELESEVGISLFRRTAKGVVPTKAGEDFLAYARSITAQMDTLEHLYGGSQAQVQRLRAAAPRASYVSAAFARCAGRLASGTELDYRELTATEVVRAVASALPAWAYCAIRRRTRRILNRCARRITCAPNRCGASRWSC